MTALVGRRPARTTSLLAVALGAGLVLTGCSGSNVAGGGPTAQGANCAAYEQYGNLAGTRITLYTSITSPEDEPLSNLDAKLRVSTRTQIASLQRRLGTTTVYVTHDQVEAMTMGDRVAVLKDGLLQQVGTPREMYDRPANVFVAGFIGSPAMNLLPIEVDGDVLHFGGADVRVPRSAVEEVGSTRSVTVGVRPEDMDIVETGAGLPTEVEVVEELGADAYVYGSTEVGGERRPIIARVDGRTPPSKGSVLHLVPRSGGLHLFAGDTGERIDI